IWKSLENLYCASGFSSEFILCREFFDTKLAKFNSMEEYLNRIKQLSDDLKAKNLTLPKQILYAWILNNLTPQYRPLVSNITQNLRNNENTFTTHKPNTNNNTYNNNKNNSNSNRQYKGKKPYKITKDKYCRNCKRSSHNTVDCYFLHPEKAPSHWNNKDIIINNYKNTQQERSHSHDDKDVDVLYTKMDHEVFDLNMTDNDNGAENTPFLMPSIIIITHYHTGQINNANCFILDPAATKHIICNKGSYIKIIKIVIK
ncbi:hypothetical protein EPUL_005900, partial [Erysiphe pulchra]